MKLWDMIRGYVDGEDLEENENYDTQTDSTVDDLESTSPFKTETQESTSFKRPMHNVVSIHQNSPYIVLKKITKFEDAQEVADALNDKKVVVLNLESCEETVSVRVIDFLSGVAYANGGSTNVVANGAYVITPVAAHLEGDFAERMESCDLGKEYFE